MSTNWLNIVKTAPLADQLLDTVPLYEKALTMVRTRSMILAISPLSLFLLATPWIQALRGICIHHDPANIVMVHDHRVRLRALVTSVADFRTRRCPTPQLTGLT